MCRRSRGTPSTATRSQRIFPVGASSANSVHRCVDRSVDASPSPYSPGRNVAFGSLLTALVTNTRSPQTIGLECARPGIGVRQRTCSPVFGFQASGSCWPSATPAACEPRNDAQLPLAGANGFAGGRASGVTMICRRGTTTASDARRHELRSRITRRVGQGSAISANVGCPSTTSTR